MQVAGPRICTACAHLHKERDNWGQQSTCDAFPAGIPPVYFSMGDPHQESDGTDNGIIFELDKKREVQLKIYKKYYPDFQSK